jgi:hypothetical protein
MWRGVRYIVVVGRRSLGETREWFGFGVGRQREGIEKGGRGFISTCEEIRGLVARWK